MPGSQAICPAQSLDMLPEQKPVPQDGNLRLNGCGQVVLCQVGEKLVGHFMLGENDPILLKLDVNVPKPIS